MHLARGRNTSSFGFFASFEQLQGSCVILANQAEEMSSKRVEKPLFQRLRFSFLLSRSHRLSRSSPPFLNDWKQIILLELPPSSWSVIGLVPRQHTDATRFCLRFSRSTVIVDPFFFISISGKPQLSWFFFSLF